MKAIGTLLALALVAASPALAQEQTLISGDIEHGGFGGPIVGVTEFNGDVGLLVGGGGGWIINHTFVIGGMGFGLTNNIKANIEDTGNVPLYLNIGYGGVFLNYIYNSDDVLHVTGGVMIGGGGISLREKDWENYGEFDSNGQYGHDEFFVFEPQVAVELNMTTWMRLNLAGSYRFVSGVDYYNFSNNDLSGPAGLLMVKFGKF